MNMSWPVLFLFCGLLIAIVLILFWHPQRSRSKTSTSADRQPTTPFSAMMIVTGMEASFTTIPTILRCSSLSASAWGMTMNFGHPQSKLILIAILLLPLIIAILTALISGTAPLDATRLDASRRHKNGPGSLKSSLL
jgi:hypothetical protein